MPRYKGKRSNVTFPPALYEEVADLAAQETRTVSQMVVLLVQEALWHRKQDNSNVPTNND